MSDSRGCKIVGVGDENFAKTNGKRVLCQENNLAKRTKMDISESSKRPNFSALSPNGLKTANNALNAKPGCAKKLVIKNFKGKSSS